MTGGDPWGLRLSRMPVAAGLSCWWLWAGATLAAFYLQTIPSDLAWGHYGVDGGDLVTAAATGGVAHPSGYPTYLALASLFQRIPFGTLAFRSALLSLVCTLVSALIVGWLVRRLTDSPVAAGAAALLYGLSPLAWGQALIAEVYALHALFVALTLVFAQMPQTKDARTQGDRWSGLVMGVGLGNHLTLVFMVPVWLWARLGERAAGLRARSMQLGNLLGPALIGLGIYGTLVVRAHGDSPVNWGRPDTWSRLVWLVSGGLYREHLTPLTADIFWARLAALPAWLVYQLGPLGVGLVLLALMGIGQRSRPMILASVWVFAAYAVFAVLYPTHDSQIHLLPVGLILAVWAGLGLADLLAWLAPRPMARDVATVLIVLTILLRGVWLFPAMDLRTDNRAQQFAASVLVHAPANAILVGDNDAEVFTLWYYLLALEQRPDLTIVAEGLANYDWYRQTLRHTYPDVIIPEMVTTNWAVLLRQTNDRPVCELQVELAEGLACRD